MKQIYTPVMAQLKALVPELRWIDLDTDQLNAATRPQVAFPCALIGVELNDCDSLSDTLQQCGTTVTVKMGFDNVGSTSGAAPDHIRNSSLMVYDIIEKVYKALQGFEKPDFEALSRRKQGKVPGRNGLFQYQITFSTILDDEA